jgi:eukaryotic translation initiation factor 2C
MIAGMHYGIRRFTSLNGFVAADVGHPGPGLVNRPSMTGLVGSLDRHFGRFAAFSRLQNPRTEIIENLQQMMVVS